MEEEKQKFVHMSDQERRAIAAQLTIAVFGGSRNQTFDNVASTYARFLDELKKDEYQTLQRKVRVVK